MKQREANSIIQGYNDIRKLSSLSDCALYEAHDDKGDRKVILRVFNRDVEHDLELRVACAKELHTLTRLIHPNIATVTAFGLWRTNPYSVALAVAGKTLRQIIHQGRLGTIDKYHIAVDVLRALQHAHRNGVVHGNITPMTVMFDETGQTFLTHFALCSLQTDPDNVTEFAGGYDGAFIAPERKIDARIITPATDIYAAGVLCFFLFTRQVPDEETQNDVLQAAGIDISLRKLIMSMMSRDAHLRPLDLETPIQLFLRLASGLHIHDEPIDGVLAEDVLPKDQFLFLDTLHELVDTCVYLYQRREDQKLFVAKSRPPTAGGLEEARQLMQLSHPHIVPVLAAVASQNAQVVVTEYRQGGDLLGRMAHPWSVDDALSFFENMLSALEVAHGAGVIHKNVRPWHILLDKEGIPALTDFGLNAESLAPEVMHGYAVPGEPPSEQADLFALGVLTYQLIVGSCPYFVGEQLEAAPRFKEISKPVRTVLERLLVVTPERREITAAEALFELRVALGQIMPLPAEEVEAASDEIDELAEETKQGVPFGNLAMPVLAIFLLVALVWGALSFWPVTKSPGKPTETRGPQSAPESVPSTQSENSTVGSTSE
jgi:serine/threonine protein kinase